MNEGESMVETCTFESVLIQLLRISGSMRAKRTGRNRGSDHSRHANERERNKCGEELHT